MKTINFTHLINRELAHAAHIYHTKEIEMKTKEQVALVTAHHAVPALLTNWRAEVIPTAPAPSLNDMLPRLVLKFGNPYWSSYNGGTVPHVYLGGGSFGPGYCELVPPKRIAYKRIPAHRAPTL